MSASRLATNPLRLPIWAGLFVTLVCVVVIALGGWREWQARAAVLQDAEIDTGNLARSLTQHAEDSIELADSTLEGLADRLETEGTTDAAIARIQSYLHARRWSLGRIRGIFVYDERGRWLATTENVDLRSFNNSDRDYFRRHKQSTDKAAYLGRPIRSRSGGQWIISVSRRFNHPDGSFAGVVAATLDVAYFARHYKQFDTGVHGSIALMSADGVMMAHEPNFEAYVGRDLSATELFKNRAKMPAAGNFYFTSPLDGRARVSFYKRSDKYPVTLLATEDEDDVLTPWRHDALIRMGFVLTLTLLIAVAGFFLIRQLFERQRIQAMLAAKEADFRRLAEASSDMVARIGTDERIIYASPSSSRVVGWEAKQLIGTPALAGVHAEDRPRVREVVGKLKRGDLEEARISYRTRRRRNSEIWVETALRATRNPSTGAVDGIVAVSRGMTERKNLEAQLAALATSDSLTGLGNRRRFDEQMKIEWARAAREGAPLSLLLIDIDRYKKFNDQYGHQAGDTCLRRVSQAVLCALSRPADLAIRYGGDELVVLLPRTDEAGSRHIGETIRDAVQSLNIGHSENPPWGVVTLSVGGATITPGLASEDSASLIRAADQALYAAKAGGRNRLSLSNQPAIPAGEDPPLPPRRRESDQGPLETIAAAPVSRPQITELTA